MGLDEQIDSIFERAQFLMNEFNEDSSEINTDYSGSPADHLTKENSYSGED